LHEATYQEVRIFYQYKPERLSACPLTIHALLHVADCIEAVGPVWASWAFAMERYCGSLTPAIRSRKWPNASINRRMLEQAQLYQTQMVYNLHDQLQPPREKSYLFKKKEGYEMTTATMEGIAYPQCESQ